MRLSIGGRRRSIPQRDRGGKLSLLALLIMGLALPVPSVFAHGNQFIGARVVMGNDGLIALELSVDHSDNPNIADAQAARSVLREAVRIQVGDEIIPLELLGDLHFTECDQHAVDSLVPSADEPGPHRLVVASWRTHLPGQRVRFVAKEHTPLDVVMWQANVQPIPGQSRWIILIAGESSPEFLLTAGSVDMPTGRIAGLALLAVVSVLVWKWFCRCCGKAGQPWPLAEISSCRKP